MRDLRLILFPAIDIRDGKAVRLIQGDYEQETAYEDDPVVAARRWVDGGARWLHVVDLDGARAGEPVNLEHVRRIVSAVNVPVQLGGGLRDSKKVEEAFSSGVERVVLGTAAVRDPEWRRRSHPRTASGWWPRWTPAQARSRRRAGPRPRTSAPPR